MTARVGVHHVAISGKACHGVTRDAWPSSTMRFLDCVITVVWKITSGFYFQSLRVKAGTWHQGGMSHPFPI